MAKDKEAPKTEAPKTAIPVKAKVPTVPKDGGGDGIPGDGKPGKNPWN